MDIRWHLRALADLEKADLALAIRDPDLQRNLVPTIREAVGRLSSLPNRGRPGRWPGTRELVIPSLGYVIPYRVRGNTVEILRVFHGQQQYPPSETS